jgi:acetyl esterase/lipase
VICLQGTRDLAHPRPNIDRFVENYRKAGGQIEFALFEGEAEGFIKRNAGSPAATQAMEKIIEFVHKEMV